MIEIEPLIWKVMSPPDFRCFLCGVNQAEWKVKLHSDEVTYRTCVCAKCLSQQPYILAKQIINKGGAA